MPQQIDKKYNVIFYVVVFIFLSTINNYYFTKNKDSFLKIKDIQVKGLEISLNSEIRQNLNFLVGKNIFYIDVKILKKKLSSFNYIENYRVSKLFPSMLKVEYTKTKFLAKTYKEGKKINWRDGISALWCIVKYNLIQYFKTYIIFSI